MAFSNIMRLKKYASLVRILPEVEINIPHNSRVENLFLRNWRLYEGLQKDQEDGNCVKLNTMEDLKNFNEHNNVIPI